jgi:cytochrome b561
MIRSTTDEWGWPAKLLHWLGAAFILVLLVHGWWMTHLAARPDRLANYGWHAAIGYDLMGLLVLRLLWRWANPVPALPGDLKPWERTAAHLGHFGLYVLMLATTLTGWAMAGTGRVPLRQDLLGIEIPLIVQDRALRPLLEESHKIIAYLLAALVVVHVAGALRHHFVKRNTVLRRMTVGIGPQAREDGLRTPSTTP